MTDECSQGLGVAVAGLWLAVCLAFSAQAQSVQPTRLAQPQPQSETPRPDQPVAADVDWERARADAARSQSVGRLTVARAPIIPVLPRNIEPIQLAGTQVPILTPSVAALGFERLPDAMLFARGDFYTLVIEGDGLIIEIFGTRLAHARTTDPRTARYLRGAGEERYRTTRTRSGRELTFTRYNVAYSVTLDCDAPEQDERCVSPEYGERVMRSLHVMPGSGLGEGAG